MAALYKGEAMSDEMPRVRWEKIERIILEPWAAFSDASRGRLREEPLALRPAPIDQSEIPYCLSSSW